MKTLDQAKKDYKYYKGMAAYCVQIKHDMNLYTFYSKLANQTKLVIDSVEEALNGRR